MSPLPWSRTLKVVSCTFHGVAISSTIFRLVYRWYMARFWWEDGWAMIALLVDTVCLAAAALDVPRTGQMKPPAVDRIAYLLGSLGFPCVLWACRMSILFSIVRVTNPCQQVRRIAFLVGCSFFIMWAALVGQKIQLCVADGCTVASSVGLSQLITDVVSDISLVVLPIYFLRKTKITHRQRIMIFSAFSASLLITVVTILHSALLFTVQSDGIVVVNHVKTALSLIVCNLLVIVAFVYRVYRRGSDLDETEVTFTSVDLNVQCQSESIGDKYTTTVVERTVASEMSLGSMTATSGTETEEGDVELGSRSSHW